MLWKVHFKRKMTSRKLWKTMTVEAKNRRQGSRNGRIQTVRAWAPETVGWSSALGRHKGMQGKELKEMAGHILFAEYGKRTKTWDELSYSKKREWMALAILLTEEGLSRVRIEQGIRRVARTFIED